jgi:hypothetical protein
MLGSLENMDRCHIHGAAQIRRGVTVVISQTLGAPRPAAATLWRGLLSIVSCREIGRDVGLAKSGFRPTGLLFVLCVFGRS